MNLKQNINNPKISIIIPCYNSGSTIEKCINSVLAQDNVNKEIIVVDDGSKDCSLDIIKKYGNKILLLVKDKENDEQGAASARNRGLRVATGEYVAFLDSDDFYLPGYLNRLSRELESNLKLGFAFCRQKSLINNELIPWTRQNLNIWDEKYHVLHRSKIISTNIILIRKSVIDKVGKFDTSLSNGEDSDFWLRISEMSAGKFIDFYGAVYRIDHSPNQLTRSVSKYDKLNLSRKVLINSYLRSLNDNQIDKIKLVIIIRNLIYTYLPLNQGKIFTVLRFIYTSIVLLILFPLTYIKYLKGLNQDVK